MKNNAPFKDITNIPNYKNNKYKPNKNFGDSSHVIMEEILEEFNDGGNNITSYSTNESYSIEEDPDMIQCFANISNLDVNSLEFIKQHDCFLDLPDVEMNKNPLNIDDIKEK